MIRSFASALSRLAPLMVLLGATLSLEAATQGMSPGGETQAPLTGWTDMPTGQEVPTPGEANGAEDPSLTGWTDMPTGQEVPTPGEADGAEDPSLTGWTDMPTLHEPASLAPVPRP